MTDPSVAASQAGTHRIGSKRILLTQPADTQLGALKPTAAAASTGMFGPQVEWPIVPVHVALARNGHLVSYGSPLSDGTSQNGILFDNWNPALGFDLSTAHVETDSMAYDSFCNSLVGLDDGKLLMVGGNSSMSSMIYDPVSNTMSMGADLSHQRWYATTLRLPSGKILVLGGSDYYNKHLTVGLPPGATDGTPPELGDGMGAWRTLTAAANVDAFGRYNSKWFYPRAFVGPHGQVVGFSNNQIWSLDVSGKGTLKLLGTLPYKPYASESQVMYAPGKVLVVSGGSASPDGHSHASRRAVTIDFTHAKPKVQATGNVLFPGNWLNATVLPSGEVLVNGGTGFGTAPATADYTAEIWNPTTGKWRSAATAQRIRTYHSVSLLMPSGAVFTGGGGDGPYTDGTVSGPENNLNAEMYYPAYLFTKDSHGRVTWASRPAISSIAGSATYGGAMTLGLKKRMRIAHVELISLGATTHSQNTDQRRVPLSFRQHGAALKVVLPKSVGTLPPGDYELTVTSAKGVPSAAQIITIRKGAAGSVTVAGD